MPLLDHFHPPWADEAPWESIGSLWIANVVKHLNSVLPRDQYRAFARVHLGQMVEADVGEFELDAKETPIWPGESGLQTAVAPEPVLVFEPNFPDVFEIEIRSRKAGMSISAVIEFVSPSNKDRDEARTQFVAKCEGYLQQDIGLVIVDVVTNRRANLHNQLLNRIGHAQVPRLPAIGTYISAYRPMNGTVEVWPYRLDAGSVIPSVPLPLKDGSLPMIDFESTYHQTLTDHNIDYPRSS
ncbi:MAG: DUF4058 family protein [Fimbriiglobus sp.]